MTLLLPPTLHPAAHRAELDRLFPVSTSPIPPSPRARGTAVVLPDLVLGRGAVVVDDLVVPDGFEAGARVLVDAPLVVPASPGVRVLGPKPIARAVARGYVLQVLNRLDPQASEVRGCTDPAFDGLDVPPFDRDRGGGEDARGAGQSAARHDDEWLVEVRAGGETCVVSAVSAAPSRDGSRGRSAFRHGRGSRAPYGLAEVWIAPDGSACARSQAEAHGRWVPLALEPFVAESPAARVEPEASRSAMGRPSRAIPTASDTARTHAPLGPARAAARETGRRLGAAVRRRR
ncbi:hypothetical protein [Frondihabitans cladoniiphilus]|uniref:hypothetical protein n=1 Tax=Frondihabitans cladoniiphilus TaxID=715785 RepID=UPI0031E9A418